MLVWFFRAQEIIMLLYYCCISDRLNSEVKFYAFTFRANYNILKYKTCNHVSKCTCYVFYAHMYDLLYDGTCDKRLNK